MVDKHSGSNEQYTKRSNRFLLLLGIGVLILVTVGYCTLYGGNRQRYRVEDPGFGTSDPDPTLGALDPNAPNFDIGDGVLEAQPAQVDLTGVVLGSNAEAVVTLTAKNSNIQFIGMELAEAQDDGFTLGGTCFPNQVVARDSSCTVKVLWNPQTLRQIQNTLTVRWRIDLPNVFTDQTTTIALKGQSTDSKDCVICETPCKDKDAERLQEASLFSGKTGVVKDGKVIIDGKEYTVRDGLLIDEDGNIVGIVEPEKIPMSMANKVMGTISKTGDVTDADGNPVGRLVGDDTIVDSSLNVLGAAIPLVSVISDNGSIIGKLQKDGSVVDETGTVFGTALVDGSVTDVSGSLIGYLRPHGLVVNWAGDIIGGVVPNGAVVNGSSQVIGSIKPNGLVVNADGELIGGVVPKGIAVGTACSALGRVSMNGEVSDKYAQIVGKALLSGSVVNEKGDDIGSVVRQGLIINEKGSVIGFVNSEGKAVNGQGSVIGCVNADATVSAGSKIVGAVMPKGYVIGRACASIGSVYPNGVVLSGGQQVVGQVRPDAYVANANGKIIGVVVPRGAAVADGCRLLGMMTPDGFVVDGNGMSVGCMTLDRKIINRQNEEIGFVAPTGLVVDDSGKVIGRTRPDGKVVDKDGRVIGCINADGSVVALDGKTVIGRVLAGGESGMTSVADGVILNENGDPTGWHVVGNDVFDENGNKVGSLMPNGWVVNAKGEILGVIPPDGVIVSHTGTVLGRYTRKAGVVLTPDGERLGYVLPDYSVLSLDKSEVIGMLLPDGTAFMTLAGEFLGKVSVDGVLEDVTGSTPGVVRSDMTVVDRSGDVVGVKIPTGKVLSTLGEEIGVVGPKGEVVSPARSVIGRVLGNGMALSTDGRVLGGVFPDISVPVGSDGVLGALTYQGKINDSKGRPIGSISPFGTVFGTKDSLSGRLMRVGPYINTAGQLIGWADFKGGLNDKAGNRVGSVTVAGVALDVENKALGTLIPRGVLISEQGMPLGAVAANGRVIWGNGSRSDVVNGYSFAATEKDGVIGRVILPGVIVDAEGGVIGWTRFGGIAEDGRSIIGQILLNGHVIGEKGETVGTYIPLGTLALNQKSKLMGIVDGTGSVVSTRGEKVGSLINNLYVTREGQIIGRLMADSLAVTQGTTGALAGMAGADGTVMIANDNKPLGQVMTNGLVISLTKKVIGGLAPVGLPIGTTLGIAGVSNPVGEVIQKSNVFARAVGTGSGTIYQTDARIAGGVLKPATFIDRNGAVIGYSSGTAAIWEKGGKKLASYMAFGSALTPDTLWAGGALPLGQVVNDDAENVGVVALDGRVEGKDNLMTGRVLSDGSVAGLADKDMFSTMPYIGHTVKQGLPFGYKNSVLGRTTVGGDILDAADHKAYRELDDGTILGKEMALDGAVLSFNPATGHDGKVLGMLDGDGNVVNFDGEEAGKIAVNGTVKGNHKYKILGALIPEALVAHDCKVLGQTSYNGDVVTGAGVVIGRITPDKNVVDVARNVIGRSVRTGLVASPTGDYMGRTLPDSTVVDLSGVSMGCARDDGSVVDATGEVIGHVVERGLVLDEKGNPIGRVKADGRVVDQNGKVIGKVLGDGKGTVVDNNSRVIGRVVTPDEELMFNKDGSIAGTFRRDGTFKDPKGNEQFRVLADGRIIDPKTGRQIGTLTEDGRLLDVNGNEIGDMRVLRDADGNLIGIIDDEGNIIDADGNVIGRILPDGTMVDKDGNIIGKINSDGTVSLNGDGKNIKGRVIPKGEYTVKDGKVYDKNGKLLGTLGADGKVRDANGDVIGWVDKDGNLVMLPEGYKIKNGNELYDPDGNFIGYVDENGNIYDKDGNLIGRINPDGSITLFGKDRAGQDETIKGKTTPAGDYVIKGDKVYDKNGNLVGTVGADGKIRNADGDIIGWVNPDGSVTMLPKGYKIKNGNELYDDKGNFIGYVDKDGYIRDKDGNIIGKINPDGSITMLPKGYTIKNGNELYDENGNFIGYVDKDGYIRDKDGNIIGMINPDGSITLFGKKGLALGTVTGDLSLIAPDLGKAEALAEAGAGRGAGSGRRIFLNGKLFDVTPQGSLVDKDGNIIGYMGEDGRPYSLDERPLTGKNSPLSRPDVKKPTVVHPDQREAMDGLLANRRAAMKSKIRSFERLLPDARTLARARKKEDLDWGEPKIVSSYPVDMSRMILKDKAIPAVLVHSIDSRYADVPVTAIVERHIYAESGRRIIIPAGSRLIGTGGNGGGGKHVNKMTFTWTRLIRPDGSAFTFSATSGDAQGRGGVPAYLDEQLLKKYGKPVLQSTLTSAIAFITATNDDITTKDNGDQVQSARAQAANDARTNFIDSMSQIFQQLLDEAVNVEDVVFVPAGTRMTVYSNSDLWLRSEQEDEEDYLNAYGADTKQAKGSSKGNWTGDRSAEMSELAAEKGITAEVGEGAIYADDDYYDPGYNDGAGMNNAGQMAPIYDGNSETLPTETPEPEQPQTPKKSGAGSVQPIFPKQQQATSRSRLF